MKKKKIKPRAYYSSFVPPPPKLIKITKKVKAYKLDKNKGGINA